MFTGFSSDTSEYLMKIALDNSKGNYERLRPLYQSAVRAPLLSLHETLLPCVSAIDAHICTRPARCISGAFNDLRFHPAEPLKTYFYLHFIAERGREENLPGFFFDADRQSYRYGLMLYHATPAFMQALRARALDAPGTITAALKSAFSSAHTYQWEGDLYKRDQHADIAEPLHTFLQLKRWCVCAASQDIQDLRGEGLAIKLADGFQALAPLYRWMNID